MSVLSFFGSSVRDSVTVYGHRAALYCLRLHFTIKLLPMQALCGLINKPLILKIRSRPTGSEVSGVQKIFSNHVQVSKFSIVSDFIPQFHHFHDSFITTV